MATAPPPRVLAVALLVFVALSALLWGAADATEPTYRAAAGGRGRSRGSTNGGGGRRSRRTRDDGDGGSRGGSATGEVAGRARGRHSSGGGGGGGGGGGVVAATLAADGSMRYRTVAHYEAHDDMHEGFQKGDVYCTVDFAPPRGAPRGAVHKPAEFVRVSHQAADGVRWDGMDDLAGARLFLDPEFNAMLLYTPGVSASASVRAPPVAASDSGGGGADAAADGGSGARGRAVPWAFSVFASLEPDPAASAEEQDDMLKRMPRIQVLQTVADCIVSNSSNAATRTNWSGSRGDTRPGCSVWEKCGLELKGNEITPHCASDVQSSTALALGVPQCSSTLPRRHRRSTRTISKLDERLGERLARECNWYLQRWMVPFPDPDPNDLDTEEAIVMGKALCGEYLARIDGVEWRPMAFWMKLGMARFLSSSRHGPAAAHLLAELSEDVDKYVGWDDDPAQATPALVRWDVLVDSLAIFAQSSDLGRLRQGLRIIDRLRADTELARQVESFRPYLTNMQAMLAMKVGDLATAATAAEWMFRDTPASRYADALVLSFILVNLRRYVENAAVAFQDGMDVRLPDAEGMRNLGAVLDDVEAFYRGRLDECRMSYARFTVPRAPYQREAPAANVTKRQHQRTTVETDVAVAPRGGAGGQKVHVPVSPWTPTRLDHMPSPEEFEGYIQRREPFIISLPSQTPSRPHVPTAASLRESLTLRTPERRAQCRRNLAPFGWQASCDWTADFLCDLGGTKVVALAVPSTGPDGNTAFAGSARPKRQDMGFCAFVQAIDAPDDAATVPGATAPIPSTAAGGGGGGGGGEVGGGGGRNTSHLVIDEAVPVSAQLSKCYFDAGSPRIEKEDLRQFPLNQMKDAVPLPAFANYPGMAERFSSITAWMGHSTKDSPGVPDEPADVSLDEALLRPMPGKSGLHYDNLDNLHSVVRGRKRWRISSPNDALRMEYVIPPDEVTDEGFLVAQERPKAYTFYGFETRFSNIGSITEGVDAARFPRALEATQSVFFIDEGELLYLPAGWSHEVESEGFSVSYTFWFHSPAKWQEVLDGGEEFGNYNAEQPPGYM